MKSTLVIWKERGDPWEPPGFLTFGLLDLLIIRLKGKKTAYKFLGSGHKDERGWGQDAARSPRKSPAGEECPGRCGRNLPGVLSTRVLSLSKRGPLGSHWGILRREGGKSG